jgi:hypothetical protein
MLGAAPGCWLFHGPRPLERWGHGRANGLAVFPVPPVDADMTKRPAPRLRPRQRTTEFEVRALVEYLLGDGFATRRWPRQGLYRSRASS